MFASNVAVKVIVNQLGIQNLSTAQYFHLANTNATKRKHSKEHKVLVRQADLCLLNISYSTIIYRGCFSAAYQLHNQLSITES